MIKSAIQPNDKKRKKMKTLNSVASLPVGGLIDRLQVGILKKTLHNKLAVKSLDKEPLDKKSSSACDERDA
jgi:hypothetical protein